MGRLYAKGFTVLEVLIVVAIIGILVGFSVVGVQNMSNYQRYDYALGSLETALLDSKNAARNSVNGEAHGIKFASDGFTLFLGDTYSAGNPANEVISFNEVTFTYNLTGGTDEIIFTELSGLPSATGTITVVGTAYDATTTVTVTSSGVIQ